MKLAVTAQNGQVFQHFGKCPSFAVFTVEGKAASAPVLLDATGSGHAAMAGFLKNNGVDTVICGGIGAPAKQMLLDQGIQVVSGASGDIDCGGHHSCSFRIQKGLSALFFCTKPIGRFTLWAKGCGIMNQINYDRQMQAQIESLPSGSRPTLLLHSCCGPCSSAVLERLAPHFDITVFFYNPNILPAEEYQHRLREQRRLLRQMVLPRPIVLWEGPYELDAFFHQAHGLENEPAGGRRCTACFSLRLQRTAETAAAHGFDFFTTTLSVSPHKNAALLNEIGAALQTESCRFLFADFKKRGGYQRSLALSRQYGLYRQRYCGCPFSLR